MDIQTNTIKLHQQRLRRCALCPGMYGPPVTGEAVVSPVMLVGQAPGIKEIEVHRPFAWTAGKTLFTWFENIGVSESTFRAQVYMAAVCRCFPGKKLNGGDRPPNRDEIANCAKWLQEELRLLQPLLVLPVGKLAISQFIPVVKLAQTIGKSYKVIHHEHSMTVIPLPHPSGVSVWHRTQPGKTLLKNAMQRINRHPAWKAIKNKQSV